MLDTVKCYNFCIELEGGAIRAKKATGKRYNK